MGDWARTFPSAETVASSLPWSSMLAWIPAARAMVAAEQVELEPALGAAEALVLGAGEAAAALARSIKRIGEGMAAARVKRRMDIVRRVGVCILRMRMIKWNGWRKSEVN